ncbi:SnoaL-like domain-containing protein [Natronoarchaeum philippinense]|uniref:SnoaL-like domain-containing protein n=1 Tax=Natronoarchaeum philippinense TaxID=558529 RepID=A0A285N361_NATPI|nr:AtzH-like domain-containing protein [Natronoarchaeum philippinense]SNZ03895.1 SnoaL-like domain-containing protein [Natronoarchaeum philippinense]
MTAAETIGEYYDALQSGDPLAPFFSDRATVKFGVGESLFGADEIRAALREQTATTEDWQVDSTRLDVTAGDGYAWFGDEVELAWTDAGTGQRWTFDTRWSGTLERIDGEWQFVSMHVSAPRRL